MGAAVEGAGAEVVPETDEADNFLPGSPPSVYAIQHYKSTTMILCALEAL